MYKLTSTSVIAAAFVVTLGHSCVSSGQIHSASKENIYRNFLGRWIGTDEFIRDGARVHEHFVLTATEDKNGRWLKMEYVYGNKGDSYFGHVNKSMAILPSEDRVEIRVLDADARPVTYKAIGLDQFAKTGLGTLNIFSRQSSGAVEECSLELKPDSFSYYWATGQDGTHYKVTSIFKMRRDPTYKPGK